MERYIRNAVYFLVTIPILLFISGCGGNKNQVVATQEEILVVSEFIFDVVPFASCHASTIVQTEEGLVAAWFGGSEESEPDVSIWLSRRNKDGWSSSEKVGSGSELSGRNVACWNPVLFQPKSGPLILFYKVGDDEPEWWGEYKTSYDGGKTWSKAIRLPDGFLGPIKNKPIQLSNGSILSPSSIEYYKIQDDDTSEVWLTHLELSSDMGKTWKKIGPLNDGKDFNVIQGSLLSYPNGKMQILCRTEYAKRIYQSWSNDQGNTWNSWSPTELPNPDSGTDAVMLADGRALLVYNHSTSDGLVHITYTWNRERIKHVVLNPKEFVLKEIQKGVWPE